VKVLDSCTPPEAWDGSCAQYSTELLASEKSVCVGVRQSQKQDPHPEGVLLKRAGVVGSTAVYMGKRAQMEQKLGGGICGQSWGRVAC
jgi:hypothetical protein